MVQRELLEKLDYSKIKGIRHIGLRFLLVGLLSPDSRHSIHISENSETNKMSILKEPLVVGDLWKENLDSIYSLTALVK